jgi:hypothetical protein
MTPAAIAAITVIVAAVLFADLLIERIRRIDRDHDRDQRLRDLKREIRRYDTWEP